MKFRIISPDARGTIDAPLRDQLLTFLECRNSDVLSDIVLVPVTYHHNYQFNPVLLTVRKYVLVDMTEQGWNWDGKSENRLGLGALRTYQHFDTNEWGLLDDWIRQNPPILTFKRELLAEHRTATMQPIEYLCVHPVAPTQSREDWERRPFAVFHSWGWSNPARALLHADIFRAMTNKGIEVISEFRHFDSFKPTPPGGNVWATIYAPWFCRNPDPDLLKAQRLSKISVSLPGAGKKCFRHAEAPNGAVMALPYDNLAWSYPWTHRENCWRLSADYTFDDLYAATCSDTYDIYQASQETISKYRSETYVKDYFLPTLESVL